MALTNLEGGCEREKTISNFNAGLCLLPYVVEWVLL